jgi:hypothetical protein
VDQLLLLQFSLIACCKNYCSKPEFIISLFFEDFLHHVCAMMCFNGFHQSNNERDKCLIAKAFPAPKKTVKLSKKKAPKTGAFQSKKKCFHNSIKKPDASAARSFSIVVRLALNPTIKPPCFGAPF